MNFKYISKIVVLISASVAIIASSSCADKASAGSSVYPIAKPVLDENGQPKKNLFISPYKPYNPIDTRGYESGRIVGDPSTAKIDKKTGKLIPSTVKAFRIP